MSDSSTTPEQGGPRAGSPVFALHVGGKMEIASRVALDSGESLSLAYTPGVAEVCEAIAAEPALVDDYTWVSNTVAVVTDGTAVLGLGDIGPAAGKPVMEGKACLFKKFADIDVFDIEISSKNPDHFIETVKLPE